jgi:hypothetical protein
VNEAQEADIRAAMLNEKDLRQNRSIELVRSFPKIPKQDAAMLALQIIEEMRNANCEDWKRRRRHEGWVVPASVVEMRFLRLLWVSSSLGNKVD